MKRVASGIVAVACVLVLASCSLLPGRWFGKSDTVLSNERAVEIVDAINAHDAAALKGMFTKYARTEYSAEIDKGLKYLLSMFPDGDVVIPEPSTGSVTTGAVESGKRTTLGGGSHLVTSGGKEYNLSFADFTVNTIDPENVGIYKLGAVLHTDSRSSDMEVAYRNWASSIEVDARVGSAPGVFVAGSAGLSHDRAAQIIDAINAHDAATLKGMFTEYARAEQSPEIDAGLEYLLSMFPDGDIAWQDNQGASAVCERTNGDTKTVLLPTFYSVSSGGVDYRLFFADFTENMIDPGNVGIYAIGAVPIAETPIDMPEAEMYSWSNDFYIGATAAPGVFIPKS